MFENRFPEDVWIQAKANFKSKPNPGRKQIQPKANLEAIASSLYQKLGDKTKVLNRTTVRFGNRSGWKFPDEKPTEKTVRSTNWR